MRKFLIALSLIFLAANFCLADDFTSTGDLWDNFNTTVNPLSKDQKAVSDEQFNSIVDKLKSKRQKKPKQMKGTNIQQSNETEELVEVTEELPVVCIAVPLRINEDSILPVGHYQVKGEIVEGTPRIKLFQAHFLMADFPAVETNDDFNEEDLNFVKLIDDKGAENQLKLIFGSMDFNAYTLVETAE